MLPPVLLPEVPAVVVLDVAVPAELLPSPLVDVEADVDVEVDVVPDVPVGSPSSSEQATANETASSADNRTVRSSMRENYQDVDRVGKDCEGEGHLS